MNRFSALFLVFALGCFFASCSGNPVSEEAGPKNTSLVTKAVNSSESAIDGSVVVRLGGPDAAVSALSVQDRGFVNVKRIFPPVKGKEEIERRHGLDRWYDVGFPAGVGLVEGALILDGMDVVERIEFKHEPVLPFERSDYEVPAPSVLHAAADPVAFNDPLFDRQWFLYNNGNKQMFGSTAVAGADVKARDAWRLTAGDPSVVVAVLDEGVKYTHPDLAANMWRNEGEIEGNGIDDDGNGYVDDIHGYNFQNGGAISWGVGGDAGHATHVAGLVAAVNGNGVGVSSIAGGSGKGDGVRLMSCQILSAGKMTYTGVAEAIKYAADNGASVLQCSFGEHAGPAGISSDSHFERSYPMVVEALNYFTDPANSNCDAVDGNIVVFSAGNDGYSRASYPGAWHRNICVAAVAQDNLPGWYTNYGPGVTISAPGGDNNVGITMLSTMASESDPDRQDYAFMHGTSMATPVVSGIVALGLSYARQLGRKFSHDEFVSMVQTSVDGIDSRLVSGTKPRGSGVMQLSDYRGKMGTGTINAWKLLMQVEGTPFVQVEAGKPAEIDLEPFFGGGSGDITYLGADISAEDKAALGLGADPSVSGGKLRLGIPSNVGRCAKITVRAVAGGAELGGGDKAGGLEISKTISIICRGAVASNGGWL